VALGGGRHMLPTPAAPARCRGMSGGEMQVPPQRYRSELRLPETATNSDTWLNYAFNWQPSHVTWYINGKVFRHNYYNQNVTWADMKGKAYRWAAHRQDAAISRAPAVTVLRQQPGAWTQSAHAALVWRCCRLSGCHETLPRTRAHTSAMLAVSSLGLMLPPPAAVACWCSRIYRTPTAASKVVFSIWSDGDQTRGFGGKLDWDKSPYESSFADLRRCARLQPQPVGVLLVPAPPSLLPAAKVRRMPAWHASRQSSMQPTDARLLRLLCTPAASCVTRQPAPAALPRGSAQLLPPSPPSRPSPPSQRPRLWQPAARLWSQAQQTTCRNQLRLVQNRANVYQDMGTCGGGLD